MSNSSALSSSCCALILAAGKGTRMHSKKPKVLHTILGEPLLGHVAGALRPLFGEAVWAVIGHEADMVRAAFAGRDLRFVEQKEQLGTGHALMVALPELKRAGMKKVLVVNGDTPLITTDTLRDFMFYAEGADVSVATLTLENPGAYGRIVRQNGELRAIVEAKDFDVAVHGEPTGEINAGIYMLNLEAVEILVPKLGNENKSGEYYITDLVGMAVAEGTCAGCPAAATRTCSGSTIPPNWRHPRNCGGVPSWRNGWRPAWPCTARTWSVWARM